jgi:hypothetical protein
MFSVRIGLACAAPLLDSPPAPGSLRWLDLVGLACVVVLALVGARRGLWWQSLRLLGLIAAVAVARAAAPRFAALLREVFGGLEARLSEGLAWALVFGCGLLVVALVGRLVKRDAGEPRAAVLARSHRGRARGRPERRAAARGLPAVPGALRRARVGRRARARHAQPTLDRRARPRPAGPDRRPGGRVAGRFRERALRTR